MAELNLTYNKSINNNFLYSIKIIDNGVRNLYYYKHICTCGYKDKEIVLEQLKECPKCKAKLDKIYEKTTLNHETYQNNFISEMKFTKLKGYIKYLYVDITVNELNESIILKREIEVDLEYVKNKKGNLSYHPKIYENNVEHKWLKNTIENLLPCNRYSDESDKKALDILDGISAESCYNISSYVWNIHNKYKHGRNLLNDDFFYRINGSIDIIKQCNKLYPKLPHDKPEYMDIIIKDLLNYENLELPLSLDKTISGYRLANNFANPTIEYLNSVKNLINIKSAYRDRLDEFRNYYGNNFDSKMVEFIHEMNVDMDTILEFLAHAERQSYDVSSYSKMLDFKNAYTALKHIGLPIDWKPKEVQIYIDKANLLRYILVDLYNKDFLLNKYNVKIDTSYKVVKLGYDMGGFKLLDKMLFNRYSKYCNKGYSHCILTCGEEILPAILMTKIQDNTLITDVIYTANEIIEDRKQCEEYLDRILKPYEIKTKKNCKKGRQLCETTV